MKGHIPLILVSNDDGYMAKGFEELIHAVKPLGEIIAMAPARPRSASGCSLTMNVPVNYKLRYQEPGISIYSCSGTPADCTKLALHTVCDRMPDLIISGINHGDNSSINAHYSGTMSVVFEGCMKGIPSIGFSLRTDNLDADFTPTLPYIYFICESVLKKGLPQNVCLNVNFPEAQNLKGIRICRQGEGTWINEWEQTSRRGDNKYFWMAGDFIETHPEQEDTDLWALRHGYASVVPLTIDLTAYRSMSNISRLFT